MSKIMRIRLLAILILLLTSTQFTFADDDPDTPWTVEKRCVAAPTQPPEDWSYPGTLLLAGYAGIHAMQSDWQTPRVEALFYNEANGDTPLVGGQLSPDGKWYAVPIGERFMEISFNIYHFVHGIRLYNTIDETVLTFDLSDYAGDYVYYAVAWSYLPVEWVDNHSLIIGGIHLYPFENRADTASFDTKWSTLSERFISPDHTRAYSGYGINGTYLSGLYDPEKPETTFEIIGTVDNVVWKRDSTGFIAQSTSEDQPWNGLSLYDQDGQELERIFALNNTSVDFGRASSGRNEAPWSPDNTQIAFALKMPYPDPARLYLMDFLENEVIDTCLNLISRPVWSPDGKQIAYLAIARENLKIVVFDIEDWQAYDVARHSGVSGAFIPDTVGWRTNDS